MSAEAADSTRMAQLIVTLNSGQIVMDLGRPVTTIGRSRAATIRIEDRSISGLHCEVVKMPAGYLLVDHGSRNGTVLRQQEVSEIFLRNGDVFIVGHATVRYVGPDPDEKAMLERAPAPVAAAEEAPAEGTPSPATAPAKDPGTDTHIIARPPRRRRHRTEAGIPAGTMVFGLVIVIALTAGVCWMLWGPQTEHPRKSDSGAGKKDGARAVDPAPEPVHYVDWDRGNQPAAAIPNGRPEPVQPVPEPKRETPIARAEEKKPAPEPKSTGEDWPPAQKDDGVASAVGVAPGNAGAAGDPAGKPAAGETKTAEDAPADRRWDYDFMGVSGNGTHVCFVLDASASMSLPTQSGKLKRDKMKKQLIDAVQDLDPEVSFAVVFFTAEAYPMAGKFVKATAAAKAEAVKWVQDFERRGATNLWSGLQKAFELVQKIPAEDRKQNPFRVTLYVLSDGRVRDSAQILGAAAAAVKGSPVTIHTISFDEKDQVLQELAKVGGGDYQIVK